MEGPSVTSTDTRIEVEKGTMKNDDSRISGSDVKQDSVPEPEPVKEDKAKVTLYQVG
jgi:hypothetical protein